MTIVVFSPSYINPEKNNIQLNLNINKCNLFVKALYLILNS